MIRVDHPLYPFLSTASAFLYFDDVNKDNVERAVVDVIESDFNKHKEINLYLFIRNFKEGYFDPDSELFLFNYVDAKLVENLIVVKDFDAVIQPTNEEPTFIILCIEVTPEYSAAYATMKNFSNYGDIFYPAASLLTKQVTFVPKGLIN